VACGLNSGGSSCEFFNSEEKKKTKYYCGTFSLWRAISSISKEAGKSLQRFSDSYTLKDEYYHCLTSSATTMEKLKCPIIV